jgi:4-amino-4-deoxy-L-arabinose transferase-like glycosyltransferase
MGLRPKGQLMTATTLPDFRAYPASTPAPPSVVDRRWPLRSAVGALLALTAVLYTWGLGASGYANSFYAAAVQAGTESWKAFLFGSIDKSNFITVDKPPASLWVMELSGRIFGFSSWSMLVPQALEGVAAVGLLYLTVRRWFGPAAGLIAGTALALTPVAVLMFRFNNPDALLTLLLVAGAYCVTRALDNASTRWLMLAGVALGFAFLTKSLQAFTVLPAFALAYVVAAPTGLRRRLLQLLAAGAAVIVSAGWWVLTVTLWPVGSRPYIGGSGDNTVLGLAFGYNGLGRITGNENGGGASGGGAGGGGGGPTFSGSTGLTRLFGTQMGSQISWLLPAALIGLLALLVIAGRRARTDRMRAAALLWGGWLLVTGLVLSYASGVIHPYYTVELAPAIAALVGIATVVLWRRRADINARMMLAVGVIVTGIWSYELLQRTSDWYSWLRYLVAITAVVGAVLLVVAQARLARYAAIAAIVGLVSVGSGSAAYAVQTASVAHTGSTPSAGPASTSGGFGGGAGGPGGGGFGGTRPSGTGGFGGPGAQSAGGTGTGIGTAPTGDGSTRGTTSGGAGATGVGGGGASTNSALVALLKAAGTKWAAATVGSQSAATLELSSDTAVIAIGGFSGSDDAPTLAQFEKLVASGQVRYFISGGQGGGGMGGGSSSSIASWVSSHFTASTVGGQTVYDLSKETTS